MSKHDETPGQNQKTAGDGPARQSRRGFFKLAGAVGVGARALGEAADASAAGLPAPKANAKKWIGGKFPKGPVMAKGRVLGANDRINVAHIGVGGQGRKAHVTNFVKNQKEWNTASIALADPYANNIELARKIILGDNAESQSLQIEKDYRRVLENKDVDAVIVATPEHWHCEVAVHALEAGKHAYVEKPMARYLDEAFQLYDTWKKTGKVVQVGSQGTSDPKYHAARDIVASGKLGPLVSAMSSYTRNTPAGEWNYKIDDDAGPANLDWDIWLGSAAKRPWNDDSKARFFRYRKYRDYSAGILGDLMPHRIHPLLLTMGGMDWPLKVNALGNLRVTKDREVSDSVYVMAEMSGGWTFQFVGSTINEQGLVEMVRGHKASLYLAGKEPEVKPERPFAEEIEGGMAKVEDSGESVAKHEKNFLEAIRDNKQPNCNMELAIRTQTLVSLAEISETSGKSVLFDPAKRTWKFA